MNDEGIKEVILSRGFVIIEDAKVGERVEDFARKYYPFQNEDGLCFLQETLIDKRVVDLVESLFERSGLGMFKVRGPHSHCARAPLNKTTDEILVVNAMHCSPGTKIVLYENSYKLFLDARPPRDKKLDTGLLEISSESISEIPEITVTTKTLPDGGLILFDGRFFSTILQGAALEVGFADREEIKRWNKMQYPDSTSLRKIVDCMGRENIKMNIEFVAGKIRD